MLQKTKNNWLKFHHCLFAGLIWTVIFCFIQTYEGNFVVTIQKAYISSNVYQPFELITCDYKIPIISWFTAFYLTAIPSWTIVPIFLFVIYGSRRFSKLISIEIFVYIISLIIGIAFPVSSEIIQQYGKDAMIGTMGFWNNIERWMLDTNFPLLSFPSNHCINQILLMYAVIDFNFFDKTHSFDTQKKIIIKTLLTLFVSFYSIMVCASTFVLKAHFFVDWIPSFVICTIVWIALRLIKKDKIALFFNKLFTNFGWMMGYYDSKNNFSLENSVTWGIIYKDDKKPLGGGIKFFLLCDLVVCIIYGTIVAFTNLNIINTSAKSIIYNFIQPLLLIAILLVYAGCLARYAVYQRKKNFSIE